MTQIQSLQDIQTSRYPSYSLSLAVKDCWNTVGDDVQAALNDVIERCTKAGTRERKRALYMHDNPAGNVFSLSFGLCEADRISFVVRYLNYLCIIDDVLEELPHEASVAEHQILSQILQPGDSQDEEQPHTPNTRLDYISYLRDFKEEVLAVEPIRTPALLQRLKEGLRMRESSDAEFDNITDYIQYRLHNFDHDTVVALMLWAMKVDISREELASDLLTQMKYSTGVIASLSNDYFSWDREKMQHDGHPSRIRNAVGVLMRQQNFSEEEAKAGVKSIILQEETKVLSLIEHVGDLTPAVRRYLDGLVIFASGASFWCATCPRYSRPQGDMGALKPTSVAT